jgi:hypothetical protein
VFGVLVWGGTGLLQPASTPGRTEHSANVALAMMLRLPDEIHRQGRADRPEPPETHENRAERSPVERQEATPSPQEGPLALDNQRVEVDSPATHGPVEAETRPRRPGDDALTCWGNLAVVPDGCIAHPLR